MGVGVMGWESGEGWVGRGEIICLLVDGLKGGGGMGMRFAWDGWGWSGWWRSRVVEEILEVILWFEHHLYIYICVCVCVCEGCVACLDGRSLLPKWVAEASWAMSGPSHGVALEEAHAVQCHGLYNKNEKHMQAHAGMFPKLLGPKEGTLLH